MTVPQLARMGRRGKLALFGKNHFMLPLARAIAEEFTHFSNAERLTTANHAA